MFFTMASGGGLMFQIVPYNTEADLLAAVPRENTIGVVGSFDGHVVSCAEPENPTENLLWLQMDASSPVKFAATRNNPIYIHPVKSHIYKGEEWEVAVSYLYVGGKWNVFGRLYLYHALTMNEAITGGWWSGGGYNSGDSCGIMSTTNEYGTVFDCTQAYLGADALLGHSKVFKNKIDLTHYKTITFEGLFEYENANSSVIYGVWESLGGSYQQNILVSEKVTANNSEPVTLDVSELEGEYFVGFGMHSCKVRIDDIYLEM